MAQADPADEPQVDFQRGEPIWECTLPRPDSTYFQWQCSTGSTSAGTPRSDLYSELVSEMCTGSISNAAEHPEAEASQQPGQPNRQAVTEHAIVKQGAPRSWRRRRYVDPQRRDLDPDVLICGPLQRRFLGFAWRWRWCVVTSNSLLIFKDEAAWRGDPQSPQESFPVSSLVAYNESSYSGGPPHTFRCVDRDTGECCSVFSSGDNHHWVEIAATHLWVDLLNKASRLACLGQ